jgi:glycosyltransferase involved in cell wall biosynthesis
MKIVHICQSYPPMVSGQSYMVERLAKGALGLGHEVMVISASDRAQDGVHIVRLPSWTNPFRVEQRFSAWGYTQMRTALADFGAEVVHLHDPTNSGLAGASAARSLGIPVMLTTHALPWLINAYLPDVGGFPGLVENVSWDYARWFIKRRVDMVVSPSEFVAKIIRRKTGARVRVVSNGAELSRFRAEPLSQAEDARLRKKYGIPSRVPIILHVGRLDKDKNVAATIRAAARAMQKTKAHFLIAGDGVEREDLEKLCVDLRIADRTHFPGFVDSKGDLPKLFRLAKVFVTASEIEVQSLVMLEAIASGLPVVAVDATSISEQVENGRSGYLVRSGDERGMAAAIMKLLANTKARSFSIRARQIAEQHTLERTFLGYEKLYKELVARPKKKRPFWKDLSQLRA